MRILAMSDIHGGVAAVERILSTETPCDLLVLAGDITTMGTPAELKMTMERIGKFGIPVLGVAGNMDPVQLDDIMVQLGVSLNGHGKVMGGIGLFGVSGAPFSSLGTPNEIAEEDILVRARAGWKEVTVARFTVFVPHAPPENTKLDRTKGGTHVGSSAVRQFIEEEQPDAAICGHIHEARGLDTIGKTQVMNCGPAGRGCYGIVTITGGIVMELKTW